MSGAGVVLMRYPRLNSASPHKSSESESLVLFKCATICTSGDCVSTFGRSPLTLRMRSTSPSLIFNATKPECVCSLLVSVASTAKVEVVVNQSSHGTLTAAS